MGGRQQTLLRIPLPFLCPLWGYGQREHWFAPPKVSEFTAASRHDERLMGRILVNNQSQINYGTIPWA